MRRSMLARLIAFAPLASLAAMAMFAADARAQAPSGNAPSGNAQSGTLAKIAERGEIVVGHRDSAVPFSFLDDGQKPTGFALDLCAHVVDEVKRSLARPDLKVAYQTVTAQTRIPLVANGTIDMECGSTTNNAERQRQVAFSVTYFVANGRILVKASSGIEAVDGLKGKAVAAVQGANPVRALAQIDGQKQLGLRLLPAKDNAEAFLMLETDRAAAVVQDDIILAGMRANGRNAGDYRIVGAPFTVEPYGIVLRREDAPFKALVDGVLVGLMRSGAFERLYDKWFQRPFPPRGIDLALPMSEPLKRVVARPTDTPDPAAYELAARP